MGLGYSVQKNFIPVAFAADLGTATASGAISQTDLVATLPKFPRKTTLVGGRVRASAAPTAGGSLTLVVLNGTATAGSATINDVSGDGFASIVPNLTDEANVFGADVQPTIKVAGTSTASGQGLGDYDIWFDVQF